jgi:mannose-6-phosphate isomerase
MRHVARMRNAIQPYAWGSATAFTELFGIPNPSREPQAEIWMGAHPKAPSHVETEAGWERLDRLIAQQPEAILGRRSAAAFGPCLPFLFKVLAAAEPLSIQAHPDAALAAEGFARENRLGLAPDAPERNYRDPRHKPECLCALTPFWALYGFNRPGDIRGLLERLCPDALRGEIAAFASAPDSGGLRRLFSGLISLSLDEERRRAVVAEALARAAGAGDERLEWVGRIGRHYPDDIGILSPALMNVVRLEPGQALFLTAGVPHAYLQGTGVEIMANSDNVVRGGLTPKHVDIPELLRVLRFDPAVPDPVPTRREGRCETRYLTPAAEFALSALRMAPGDVFPGADRTGPEVLLCVEGGARVEEDGPGGRTLDVVAGESALVPAGAPDYRLTGNGLLYKAGLPGDER